MKRDERVIIKKITEYCDDIAELLNKFKQDYTLYLSDKYFQYACTMCIIQIGELTNRLSEEFKTAHKEIPWKAIRSMRNIHAHDYENVNPSVVWQTLTVDIPELRANLIKIMDEKPTDG